ncbi:autotransporter outer membrane beta-barrel domain-containing protein [Sphingomonas sp.]|uniref:autotransporter outer membrane beta-barrel domain-containing protein n=1 Tax=Sphingomonas sp. TaxID=28214 RepID=UPI0025FF57ED|nr:autotransporter outer membrane beta-barrel domain-containing protein [Sphingomonas sp.]
MRNIKVRTTKKTLALGVAGAALAVGLSGTAHAQCATTGAAVDCTGTVTATDVNTATAGVAGSDVTVTIGTGATVTQPGATVSPGQQGSVVIDNRGTLGTTANPVGISYSGSPTLATNQLTITNSGIVAGGISVGGVGGPISITSSGGIAGAVSAQGRGDVTIATTGTVGTPGTSMVSSDLRSVGAFSIDSVVDSTSNTDTTGGVTTTTNTNSQDLVGGTGSVSIGAGAMTGTAAAYGITGATVDVAGAIGADDQVAGAAAVSLFVTGHQASSTTTITDGTTNETDTHYETATTGGTSAIDVQTTGSLSGNVAVYGLGGASLNVDGTIGLDGGSLTSSVQSSGYTYARDTKSVSAPGTSHYEETSSYARTGGNADATVGSTGVVNGNLTVRADGDATLANAGTIARNATVSAEQYVGDVDHAYTSDYSATTTADGEVDVSTSSGHDRYDFAGGTASATNDAGASIGAINVTGLTAASLSNAGTIGGNASVRSGSVNATANDFANSDTLTYTNLSGGGTALTKRVIDNSSNSSTAALGGTASLENKTGGLIDGSASVSGLAGADVSNAGRINGNVSLSATGNDTTSGSTYNAVYNYDSTGTFTDSTTTSGSTSTSSATGGDASFGNAGMVVGGVSVNANGNATIANSGLVTGQTYVATYGSNDQSANSQTNGYAIAADGTQTSTYDASSSSSSAITGGDITGTYAGVNGAYQFSPTGASDGSVAQYAAGSSTATVTGTIIGNFTGDAGGASNESSSTASSTDIYVPSAGTTPSTESYVGSNEAASNTTYNDAASVLAVNGGTIVGSAQLYANGDATASLGNDASIGGNLSVSTNGLSGYGSTSSSAFNDSYEGGSLVASDYQSQSSSSQTAGTGSVAVTIGKATVGGSVSLNGASGTNSFSLAGDGEVGGSVSLNSLSTTTATDYSDVYSLAGGSSTETVTGNSSTTGTGGDVTATVAGVVGNTLNGAYANGSSGGSGDLFLRTNAGNASATVTGQVGDQISVAAYGTDTTNGSVTDYADGSVSRYATTASSTATGGTATLAIDSADGQNPVNFGNITVAGLAGSTATVSGDSVVLDRPGGASFYVGRVGYDTVSASEDLYPATGLASGTRSYSETAVGGASSLTNDGQIGYDGGASFGGSNAYVGVFSATDAALTNTGRIYGSVGVSAYADDFASSTSIVNLGDVTRVDTVTRTYSVTGGTASLVNSGLITGNSWLAAGTGAMTNNGVVRGDASFGTRFDNYVTRSVDTVSQIGVEKLYATQPLIAQTYTFNQNGLLGGSVYVNGAFGYIDDADGNPVKTSDINATINLNNGSVTGGGVYAEYDQATGERYTTTNVNLVGGGYLGLDGTGVAALGTAFAGVDPAIAAAGDLSGYEGGARVLGVNTLTKSGDGVFTIVGAAYQPVSNVNPVADYTLDLGQFEIQGGEVQLATSGNETFGIRGDVQNDASLVLGTRVVLPAQQFGSNLTSLGTQGIDGVAIYQKGNFVQNAGGSLTVGMMPSLVRVVDPSLSGVVLSNEPLGTQQVVFGQGLFTTPDKAWGSAYAALAPSSYTLDGNLTLNGTVNLVTPKGGLFLNGQALDLFDVSGTVTENATVATSSANNFVTFDVAEKANGSRTLVQVVATRKGYETAATTTNAKAAGTALTNALPGVVSALTADAQGNGTFTSVNQYSLTQDLATVMAGLDSQLTMAGAKQALTELAGGSYYGSLVTLKTTAPFVDVLSSRRLPEGAKGFNFWLQPTGEFARTSGDSTTGASKLSADNYGGSLGFGVATGSGEFGLGFGYGRTNSHSEDGLARATADTYLLGLYGRQDFGPLTIAGDLVYGWSNWDADRALPTLSRNTSATFDSKEVRGDLRAEYGLQFGAATVAPFGQIELRHYKFDGFTEEGAGAVDLVVDSTSKTVFTPTIGVKLGTEYQLSQTKLRPEISVSYSFMGDNNSYRDVAYAGAPSNKFRLQGVDPNGYLTLQGGVTAEIGTKSSAFVRGTFSTSGGNDVAGVRAGVVIGF